jgi:acetyl esterase
MTATQRRRFRGISALLLVALVCWRTWAKSTAGPEPEKPPPDLVNIRYGPDERNVLDIWNANARTKAASQAPLVIFFHGGGFRGGDKSSVPGWLVVNCLKAGISVASANYRLSQTAPYPAPMQDGARAIQFLRFRASEFGFDPNRFAASGNSAGAGIALWVGFHDDLADPASRDPVARQSSRVRCLGVDGAQTSYDPRFIKALIGGRAHEHAALRPFFGIKSDSDLDSPRVRRLYEDASPLNHVSSDDPPAILFYQEPDVPLRSDAKAGAGIHHPRFGAALKSKLDPLGVACVVRHQDDYPRQVDGREAEYREMADFFERNLRR